MAMEARGPGGGSGGSSPPREMDKEALRHHLEERFANVPANEFGQKITWVEVTPELAAALQRHFMFLRQRRLRERNLRAILGGMTSGKYLNNNTIWVCHTQDSNSLVVVNGQHTLEAIVQFGAGFCLPMVLDPVPSEATVETRYGLFDMGASRTETDILHMLDITLNISEEEDDPNPTFASPQAIKRSTEAITWLSTGLSSNISSWSKYQRADAVRNGWPVEIATFHRTLGEQRDPELSPNDQAIWSNFYKTVLGGTFQAPFLASLRAYPEETQRVLEDLVQFARGGGELDPEDARDAAATATQALYEVIVTDYSKQRLVGTRRNLLVWRVALFLKHARDASPEAKRDERRLLRLKGYNKTAHTWELATGNLIERPESDMVEVDMEGARERRRERR